MHCHSPLTGGCDSSVENEAFHSATLASRRVKMPPKKRIKVEDMATTIAIEEKLTSSTDEVREEATSDGEREAVSTQTEDESMQPSPSQMDQGELLRKRRFVPYWTVLFPWVEYNQETESMYCKPCCKAGRDNSYTGNCCRNFRKSSLIDHALTHDHKTALSAATVSPAAGAQKEGEGTPGKATDGPAREEGGDSRSHLQGDRDLCTQPRAEGIMENEKERGIIVAMKSVEWLAREGLPLSKLPALLQLLENLQVPHVEKLVKSTDRQFRDHQSLGEHSAVLSTSSRQDALHSSLPSESQSEG